MREPWEPFAHHGMTEDEVRAGWREASDALLNEAIKEWHNDGVPFPAIEMAIATVKRLNAEELERALPLMMRDMAITAGAAESH